MEQNNNKADGRSKNGGFRPGAGRVKGSGVPSRTKTIRFPKDLLDEVEKTGMSKGDVTRMIVSGVKNELKKKKRKNDVK